MLTFICFTASPPPPQTQEYFKFIFSNWTHDCLSQSVMGPEAQFSALVYFICVFCCSLLCLATITHIILLAWEALPFPCQPCSHTHARAHSHSNTTHLWDYRVIIKANIYLWAYSLTLTYNMQVDWFIALSHNSSCEIKLWWRTTDLL